MNYHESLAYLYARGHEMQVVNLGLTRIRALAEAAGNPQLKYPAVHIAGTNGKGSTAAMTFAIARAAGLRTGLFTSPHLIEMTERIRVDDAEITPEDFARLATNVRALGERLLAEGVLDSVPSLFEQVTLIAFLYFAERAVDLVVLEVGLGGRFDATNICAPAATAITRIDYDHQQFLGASLAEIAAEKAGIIKPGVPVVVAPQTPEAAAVIIARAAEQDAPLFAIEELLRAAPSFQVDKDFSPPSLSRPGACRLRYATSFGAYDVRLSLRGGHQVLNALTALHLGEVLARAGFAISPQAIAEGLQTAEWPGRLEWLSAEKPAPSLLLDGAHNPAGARVLRKFLNDFCTGRPVTLLFGAMADKAFTEMMEIIFPAAQQIIVTKIDTPRAAATDDLLAQAGRLGFQAQGAANVRAALTLAQQVTPPRGVICACGSLYLIGEIKRLLATT